MTAITGKGPSRGQVIANRDLEEINTKLTEKIAAKSALLNQQGLTEVQRQNVTADLDLAMVMQQDVLKQLRQKAVQVVQPASKANPRVAQLEQQVQEMSAVVQKVAVQKFVAPAPKVEKSDFAELEAFANTFKIAKK